MKLKFKEDPKEWCKPALLTLGGLVLISSLLRWRHVLPFKCWCAIMVVLLATALCAGLQPRWFRSYYRLSLRLGFFISQILGRIVLIMFFILIVTPLGWLLRLAGQDPLQLKRPKNTASYWNESGDGTPLDRLF